MEIVQAFQWVDTTIRADTALMTAATGGVFQGIADISVVAPYASYRQQSSMDVLTMNAVRLFNRIVMQIKGVAPSSKYATLITIADRIDELFKRVGPVTLPTGGVLEAHREQIISYEELTSGVQYCHLGGLFLIELQGG